MGKDAHDGGRTRPVEGSPVSPDSRAQGTSAPKGRRRAAHLGPERRRPLVLDAALRLFVDRGYRGTSMEAIGHAAGVTKPVVYACYPSKEELFAALLEREERRLLGGVAAAIPEDPDFGDLEALLAGGFTALLSAAAGAPDSWRAVFDSEHGTQPAIVRRVRRARAAAVDRLRLLIEAYIADTGARVPDRTAPALAELLASVAEGGVRILLAAGGEWTPEELGRLSAQTVVRGADSLLR